MRHQFEFSFDTTFLRRALRRDLLWKGYVLAGAFVLLAVGLRVAYGRWEPWVTAVSLGGALIVILRFHALLRQAAKRVDDLWLLQSPSRRVCLELDDEGFDVVMESARSRYRWEDMRRLWRYPDVWMIEIVRMQSVLFPSDSAPDEAREFIVERCRAHGVRT